MFERGFKNWCEQQSSRLRKELGLRAIDPLDAFALATHLGIAVKTTAQFPELSSSSRKTLDSDSGWSAITIELGKRKLIVLKASNSSGRKSSDLTHEIAHQLLGHGPTGVQISMAGQLLVDGYSRIQESEADWLSGCLLIPRAALLHIKKRIPDEGDAARQYGVSVAMLKYRLGVTGVNYQMRRAGLST